MWQIYYFNLFLVFVFQKIVEDQNATKSFKFSERFIWWSMSNKLKGKFSTIPTIYLCNLQQNMWSVFLCCWVYDAKLICGFPKLKWVVMDLNSENIIQLLKTSQIKLSSINTDAMTRLLPNLHCFLRFDRSPSLCLVWISVALLSQIFH